MCLNDLIGTVLRLIARGVLLVIGLVFFASLLVAAAVLAAGWALRYGWARLLGRATPAVGFGSDPFAQWRRFQAASQRWSGRPDEAAARRRDDLRDVEDAVVKPSRVPPE